MTTGFIELEYEFFLEDVMDSYETVTIEVEFVTSDPYSYSGPTGCSSEMYDLESFEYDIVAPSQEVQSWWDEYIAQEGKKESVDSCVREQIEDAMCDGLI